MKTYHYTPAQFAKIKDLSGHFDEGDEIIVTNQITKETEQYTVETKKMFTKRPSWISQSKNK